MSVFEHAALVSLGEHRFDGFYQFSRRLDAKLYRDPRAGSGGFVDEVDIERVFERQVIGMIVGHVGFAQLEPILAIFASPFDLCLVRNHRTHSPAPLSSVLDSSRRKRATFSNRRRPAPDG